MPNSAGNSWVDAMIEASSLNLVQGTEQAAITDASTAHALNAAFSDVEVEAALNALGTKINLILAALRAFNIVAE